MLGARSISVVASSSTLNAPASQMSAAGQQVRAKSDAKADAKKKVQPLSFGVVTRVKDGVAFARDLGFASFGELVIFVPSPARLKAMQKDAPAVNYVDGMIVGLEKDLTSVVILGNERLVKVGNPQMIDRIVGFKRASAQRARVWRVADVDSSAVRSFQSDCRLRFQWWLSCSHKSSILLLCLFAAGWRPYPCSQGYHRRQRWYRSAGPCAEPARHAHRRQVKGSRDG